MSEPAVELVEAVELSFAELYERERAPLVRLALAMVGDLAVAEELVQEAFAQTHLRWGRLRNPGAYVRTSVVNGCRSEWRRRAARRRAAGHRVHQTDVMLPADPADDAVRRAVAALPPRRRAVVVLRFYEDLSEPVIAGILGVRVGTVKSTLSRALEQLREVMEP
ncbi:MAG TPA: SigE family RNA polymerase sigma factor [Acidimicrobiales bacterium]